MRRYVLHCVATCRLGNQIANISSDMNECLEDAPCGDGQVCINTNGSYLCVCTAGYVYNMIKKTCDGEHYIYHCNSMVEV